MAQIGRVGAGELHRLVRAGLSKTAAVLVIWLAAAVIGGVMAVL